MAGSEAVDRRHRALRTIAFVLGGTSVASLLAWVFDLGSFAFWFRAVSVPGQVALIVGAVWLARRPDLVPVRTLLVAGVVGGLVGTLGYDLFRLPFVVAGLRVLAPIDSYGVLALDTATSSSLTGFVGWSYHVANGIGFGIAYAALAGTGRRWPWAIVWALALETTTVVTPFAERYALSGRWVPIAIAYAAHVPYGVALGVAVEHADAIAAELRAVGRWSVPLLLGAVFTILAAWHAPWQATAPAEVEDAEPPTVVVRDQRFEPEWLRVEVGGCASVVNLDDAAYVLDRGEPAALPASATTRVCFDEPGVHRVHTVDQPYAGGFVIVDEHA